MKLHNFGTIDLTENFTKEDFESLFYKAVNDTNINNPEVIIFCADKFEKQISIFIDEWYLPHPDYISPLSNAITSTLNKKGVKYRCFAMSGIMFILVINNTDKTNFIIL